MYQTGLLSLHFFKWLFNMAFILFQRLLGETRHLAVFNFGAFQIGCYFVVNVHDVQQRFLDARTPFHKRKFVDQKNALMRVVDLRNNQQWVIPGERPMFK